MDKIKTVILLEEDFKTILSSSQKIGKELDYDEILYHRYIEYVIDIIERFKNNKISILYPSSKKLLEKPTSGFENIYIFNNNKDGKNILRLSILEVKSFQPRDGQLKYKEFYKEEQIIFSENRSKLNEAFEDISKHNKSANRQTEIDNICNKLLSLPNEFDNSNIDQYQINNVFFEDIKKSLNLLNLNEIGSLDKLYNDLKMLIDCQSLSLVSIGTVISNENTKEDAWINKKQNDNKENKIEELTCIILKLNSPDYKKLIDWIVKFNKE